MPEHTPGPWEVAHYDGEEWYGCDVSVFARISSVNHRSVARIYGDGVLAHNPNNAERDANARLIAAAPEMLEALEKAVPWLGKMIADGGHLNSVLPRACEIALDQAEAAISKARGI